MVQVKRRRLMKILATADIHNTDLQSITPYVKGCDLVVLAGDFMPDHGRSNDLWLKSVFFLWCATVKVPIVLIPGNHDKYLRDVKLAVDWPANVHYLLDSEIVINGVRFYGTPWSHWHGKKKKTPGLFEIGNEALREKFDAIPEGVDVLISHAPPKVCGSERHKLGLKQFVDGSSVLRKAIDKKTPRLVICGHVHGNDHTPFRIGEIWVVCVSRAVGQYRYFPKYGPRLITLREDGVIEFAKIDKLSEDGLLTKAD